MWRLRAPVGNYALLQCPGGHGKLDCRDGQHIRAVPRLLNFLNEGMIALLMCPPLLVEARRQNKNAITPIGYEQKNDDLLVPALGRSTVCP